MILKDRLGNILRASCVLFDTLNNAISTLLPVLRDQTGDVGKSQVEVTLQFPDDTSQPVHRADWTKSYGEVSTHTKFILTYVQ